ncbi:hypothetical protein VKS41_002372 [Umbelopsis sp. WA50703]
MQFKFTTFLAVAVLAIAVSAKCDCDYNDQSCMSKCAQEFQKCQQKCLEKQDGQSCISDCQKDAPQGMGMGMGNSNFGGNYPQNGYQAQGYGGSPGYGAGHWQNGQWISAANGLAVQYAALAVPALAGVAAGMMAL